MENIDLYQKKRAGMYTNPRPSPINRIHYPSNLGFDNDKNNDEDKNLENNSPFINHSNVAKSLDTSGFDFSSQDYNSEKINDFLSIRSNSEKMYDLSPNRIGVGIIREKITPYNFQQQQDNPKQHKNGPVKYQNTMLTNLQYLKTSQPLEKRKSTIVHRQEINEFITELNNTEQQK